MKYASINKGRQLETVRLLASFSNSMFTGRLMWLLSSVSHFKRLCGHLGPCALTKLQFFWQFSRKLFVLATWDHALPNSICLRPRSTPLNLLSHFVYLDYLSLRLKIRCFAMSWRFTQSWNAGSKLSSEISQKVLLKPTGGQPGDIIIYSIVNCAAIIIINLLLEKSWKHPFRALSNVHAFCLDINCF